MFQCTRLECGYRAAEGGCRDEYGNWFCGQTCRRPPVPPVVGGLKVHLSSVSAAEEDRINPAMNRGKKDPAAGEIITMANGGKVRVFGATGRPFTGTGRFCTDPELLNELWERAELKGQPAEAARKCAEDAVFRDVFRRPHHAVFGPDSWTGTVEGKVDLAKRLRLFTPGAPRGAAQSECAGVRVLVLRCHVNIRVDDVVRAGRVPDG